MLEVEVRRGLFIPNSEIPAKSFAGETTILARVEEGCNAAGIGILIVVVLPDCKPEIETDGHTSKLI